MYQILSESPEFCGRYCKKNIFVSFLRTQCSYGIGWAPLTIDKNGPWWARRSVVA